MESASEVLPNLWLGGVADSESMGPACTLVVNCTTDLPFAGDPASQQQVRLPIKDNGDDSQQDILLNALVQDDGPLDAISRHLHQEGGRVLVHCRMGQQRSAAVVAAFLISEAGCSAAEAISMVRRRHRPAFLGGCVNFHRALDAFERLC